MIEKAVPKSLAVHTEGSADPSSPEFSG